MAWTSPLDINGGVQNAQPSTGAKQARGGVLPVGYQGVSPQEQADRDRVAAQLRSAEESPDYNGRIRTEAVVDGASTPPAAGKTPTWADVMKLPEMQHLSSDQLAAARNQYFVDVVAPQVPTDKLKQAREAFDIDTLPGPMTRTMAAVSDAVKSIGDGNAASGVTDFVRKGINYINESLKKPKPETTPDEQKPYDRPFAERVQGYMQKGFDPAEADTRARRDIAAGQDFSPNARNIDRPHAPQLEREFKRGIAGVMSSIDGIRMSELAGWLEGQRKQKSADELAQDPDYQRSVKAYQELRENINQRNRELGSLPQSAAVRKMFDGQSSEGVANFVNAFKQDPGGAAAAIVGGSLAPSMVMVAAATLARFGGLNIATTAGAGGAASMLNEFGGDYVQNRDGGMGHEEAYNRALIKSGVIGAFDAASLGSAGKALDQIVHIMTRTGAVKQAGKEYLKESSKQAVLGAGGETLGSVASGREPQPGQVAAEAAGEFMMGVGEGVPAVGGARSSTAAPAGATTTAKQDRNAPVNADDLLGQVEKPVKPVTQGGEAAAGAQPVLEVGRGYSGIMGPAEGGEGDVFANTNDVSPTEKPIISGEPTTFTTERGAKLSGHYALMDVGDLTVSHDMNLEKNSDFPEELQPRDRGRAAYSIHVEGIVSRLNPEQLGENPLASHGAPIIGEDGVVESGNGRAIALMKTYHRDGEKAQEYRKWLTDNAARFGINPNAVGKLKQPVLVRVRTTPVNRAEFARQANADSIARMSSLEVAKSDARRIGALDDFAVGDGGEFSAATNSRFVQRFVATLPATEQTEMVDAKGRLSQSGYTRIRNAVLARAYGDSETLMRLVESVDDSSRNISKALLLSAPRVAKLREGIHEGAFHDVDITPDLVAAVEELTRLREDGKSVGQLLAQLDMFGGKGYSPETLDLLAFLEENIRSPRRIAELIENYLNAVQTAGSPAQGDLIERAPLNKGDILAHAKKGLSNEVDEDTAGLPAREEPAVDVGRQETAGAADESAGQSSASGGADQSTESKPAGTSSSEARTAKPKPKPVAAAKPAFGDSNKIFTQDRAEQARELLKKKLPQVNTGLDPEIVQAGIELAGFYIEGGARSFAEYSSKMIADLGDAVRPYLKSWYAAVYYNPGVDTADMQEPGTIKADGTEKRTPAAPPKPVAKKSSDREFTVPTKNKNGVYGEGQAESIKFNGKKVSASIRVLQVSPTHWISAGDFEHKQGDFLGSSTPLSEHLQFNSRENAIAYAAMIMIRHNWKIARAPYGSATQPQSDVAKELVKWAEQFIPNDDFLRGWWPEHPDTETQEGLEEYIAWRDGAGGGDLFSGGGTPAAKTQSDIDAAANEAATSPKNTLAEPTEKQREAGNYQKGHITVGGLDISIENPAGSKRRPEWPTLEAHYGYFNGVPARAPDKEHVDAFVKAGTPEDFDGDVYVIDQNHADGKFDEPKVMVGYEDQAEARAEYLKNYTKGWESRIRGVTPLPIAEFKERLQDAEAFKKPQVAKSDNIEDFGAKITGARKDYAQAFRERMAEAADVDIAAEPLSKSWPEPDYQKLLDAGADAWAVAFMHAARDEIPTKPSREWRLAKWVEQVKLLRDFALGLANGDRDVAFVHGVLEKNGSLSDVAGRVELYQAVGHSQSLKGVRVRAGSYSVYEGKPYSPAKIIWSVESRAKATAMSNFPGIIASADTKADAIEAFKKKISELPAEQAEKAVQFDIYVRHKDNGFFIGKKLGKHVVELKDGFASAKEARAWKAEHQADLVQLLEKHKVTPNERRESNSPRVGEDHRNGADVTPEQFKETFGFRGGQFGNSMPQGERHSHLNEAYDALMDLAGVIGIPPKALSLNGELGLAFGARGTGGKNAPAAHYEPDTTGVVTDNRVVINLTRARGAGSLAHEWFHAVDNYFARMRGDKAGMVTLQADGKDGIRPEMLAAFKRVIGAINVGALRGRSVKLDRTRSKPYWSTGDEMAARSFESYVVAKLNDQGASNDYLANIVSQEYWDAAAALGLEKDGTYPYPTSAEIPAIRAAFDDFFTTVRTRDTERGTALFEPDAHGYRVAGDREADYDDRHESKVSAPGGKDPDKGEGSPQRDLFTESEVSREENPQPAIVVGAATRGVMRLGFDRLDTPEKAANAFAALRKAPFEKFQIIVTDAADKPIAAWHMNSGTLTQTSVYPREVLTAIYMTPGAKKVWFAHNHPSGAAEPSYEDKDLTTALAQGLGKDLGVELSGHIIIAGRRAHYFDNVNNTESATFDVPPASRKFAIPIMERTIMRQDFGQKNALSSPEYVRQYFNNSQTKPKESGLLLMDAQNRPMGFWPMSVAEMGSLRTGKADTGAGRVMQMIGRLNPGGAIIYVPGKNVWGERTESAVQNMGALLRPIDVRLIDALVSDAADPPNLVSYAERNIDLAANSFYSRRTTSGAGIHSADVRALVYGIKARWKNAPDIRVVQSVSELPASLRRNIARDKAETTVNGAWHEGQVWLVADHIESIEKAQEVVLHEVGHYGLRGLFGPEINPILMQIYLANANVRERAAVLMTRYKYTAVRATEEVLADMAASDIKPKLWEKLVAFFKNWLRRHNFTSKFVQNFTDADVRNFVEQARAFVRNPPPKGYTHLFVSDSVYSRSDAETQPAPSSRSGALDTALRVPTQALGIDRLTSAAYNYLYEKIGGVIPESVKAGVVSDFGLPEAVIDRRALMQAHVRGALRQTQGFVDRLTDLTRAESRVAYGWMTTEKPDPELIEQLPADSRETLQNLKKLISSLGKEAVRLGQLSNEVHERNPFSYLHRSYLRHETEQTNLQKASRARSVKILGDQYKGRGMVNNASMQSIKNVAPEWWRRKLQERKADKGLKGEKFIRFERRSNRGEGVGVLPGMEEANKPGRLLEVVYWPAGEPVPGKYEAWHRDAGEWEVRDVKGDKAVMWRDFTPEERARMGEIDEVKYAVAKTLHQMIHDIEVGRYLEWLTHRYGRPDGDGLTVVSASDSMFRTFKPTEWVKVPESDVPGTKVKTYGTLAGNFIPGPIWNDVRQLVNVRYAPLGETFATVMKVWKINKTALSPAVHLNNVMANVVMADWHDVMGRDLVNALQAMLSEKAEDKALIAKFEDNGGTQGLYVLSEIQREQLTPLLDELRESIDEAGGAGVVNAGAILQAMIHGGSLGERFQKAVAAAADSKVVAGVRKAADAMIEVYQAEDTVYRLAAFIKAKADGKTDAEAGKFARRSFLDYQINAPWIQMMRATGFPFVSFVYRAAPMMLETYANKPWKLMKLALVLGGLNALGYMLAGGDEDRDRRLLPKEKQGKVLGFVAPKLIRMPWNDKNGSPVFLDIRRFIPVGDILDVDQTHGAVPILPALMPGGPLAVLAELALNKNQFTGKEIAKPNTDTAKEMAGKLIEHLYRAFMPNLPIGIPNVLETPMLKSLVDAGTGKTDAFGREQSLPMALASSVGLKIGAYPADVAKRGINFEHDAQAREISENIGALRREYLQNGITLETFEEKARVQLEKRKKIEDETAERLR